jgi:hypothetical protein
MFLRRKLMSGLPRSAVQIQRSGSGDPVRYVKDMTGRFSMRPYYEPDKECEKVLTEFFAGRIPMPIDTDGLARLIERDTSDFDPGADLSKYGPDVEVVTGVQGRSEAARAHCSRACVR